jgi:Fe-S cluster assembly protein SufD
MKQLIVILDKPGKKRVKMDFLRRGEEKELIGLILGRGPGTYELEVIVDHQQGKSFGRVMIRGIAKNKADVKVTGTIIIAKKAQGVDDFLEMKLLLLDDQSRAWAEPQLEIEANDVKASHAATVGQVDEEQLFYLQSRGISPKAAEAMLVNGFLGEVIAKINDVKIKKKLMSSL